MIKFVQYSEGDYFCTWRHVICWRSFNNVMLMFDHFQYHCTIGRQHSFDRNVNRAVDGNNETENSTVNLQYIIWMNEHWTVTLMIVFVHISMIYHQEKVFSAEKTLCNVTQFFYHNSVVIQHLVSDRLLSFR